MPIPLCKPEVITVRKKKAAPNPFLDSDGACTIERFIASKDPYRIISGDKIPIPWPYNQANASELGELNLESARRSFWGFKYILDSYGINLTDTQIVSMSSRALNLAAKDTLILCTDSEANYATWKAAANEVYESVQRFRSPGWEYRVEIRNPEYMVQDCSGSMRGRVRFQAAAEEIMNAVNTQIKDHIPQRMNNLLTFGMIGQRNQRNNAAMYIPTVTIGFRPCSYYQWDAFEKQVEEALCTIRDHDFEVDIKWVTTLVDCSFEGTASRLEAFSKGFHQY